jgi:hypothetical protein
VRTRLGEARYTRSVGQRHMRSLSVLLVGVLAVAPAATMLCAARCSAGPAWTTSLHSTDHSVHHHAGDVAQEAAPELAGGMHKGAASHPHHQSLGMKDGALSEFNARLNASGGGCCSGLGQAPRAVPAGRADADAVSTPQTAGLLDDVAVSSASNRLQATPGHMPPRARSSPAHAPFVLRI